MEVTEEEKGLYVVDDQRITRSDQYGADMKKANVTLKHSRRVISNRDKGAL